MYKSVTTALMLGMSLTSFAGFNTSECEIPGSLERGENIIHNVNGEFIDGRILKERGGSSEDYFIIQNLEPSNEIKKYSSYVYNSYIYRKYGCNNEYSAISVGDIVYYEYTNNYKTSYKKVVVEAMNYEGEYLIISNKSLTSTVEEENLMDRASVYISNLYGTNSCTTKTDDGVELCPGDYAVSFNEGVDVKVLALNDSSLLFEINGQLKVNSISNFIKSEFTDQMN